ncbi:MAG: FliG C-terminal domain-containing protein, partial [Massilia sp.]
LGSDIANSVLNTIYGDAIRPMMARLQYASPKWLAEFVASEHVQMQAVFLAFLPPALAGQILEGLPTAGRELVLLNLARLDEIDRDLLQELEDLVARCLAALDTQSASVEGVRQVAEILNRLPSNRAGMVELLRAHDPEVVSQIEMSMYDFFILSRQTEQTITRLLDEVPLEQWAIALKGAEPELRDAILTAMPRRQAQSFEDLMRRSGPVPMSRIEQTRKDIMAAVKALADAGEIDVQLFAEATAE